MLSSLNATTHINRTIWKTGISLLSVDNLSQFYLSLQQNTLPYFFLGLLKLGNFRKFSTMNSYILHLLNWTVDSEELTRKKGKDKGGLHTTRDFCSCIVIILKPEIPVYRRSPRRPATKHCQRKDVVRKEILHCKYWLWTEVQPCSTCRHPRPLPSLWL